MPGEAVLVLHLILSRNWNPYRINKAMLKGLPPDLPGNGIQQERILSIDRADDDLIAPDLGRDAGRILNHEQGQPQAKH